MSEEVKKELDEEKKEQETVPIKLEEFVVLPLDFFNSIFEYLQTKPVNETRHMVNALDPQLGNIAKPLKLVLDQIALEQNNEV